MKTFKKLMAVVLAVMTVALCFAACGGKTSNTEYFIGATGPLTGDTSSYGNSVNNGAKIAIEEINAAGGLNGYTFKYEMKDDKSTAEDAATGYDALMDAGMQISIGSVTSGSCESFATKAVEDNLFFITPSASAANVIENRANAFRVCFGDPDQGILAAEELTANYTKIGVIYDTSDPYSTGIFEAFEGKMKDIGAAYEVQSFDAENKKDFSTQIEALKDCEVIFLPIYYTEAGLIAKACGPKGCEALLFGCDGLDGVADQVDDTVKNDIKYITPFDANSERPVVSAFVEKYKATYNETPDQFAADGYDAVYAVYNAMKAAIDAGEELTPDTSASDMCEAVKAAITADGFVYDGATGKMTWDATGACTKEPQIVDLSK